jgi:hypothetical protein
MTLSAADEVGRTTRAYVSGYNRSRVHTARLYGNETRALVADFSAVLGASRTIASVLWKSDGAGFVNMSAPVKTTRTSSITISTMFSGITRIRCAITTDTGEVYTQLFLVQSLDAPFFSGDQFVSNGVTQLSI